MKFDRLIQRGEAVARDLQRLTIERLVQNNVPPGVQAEQGDDVIILSGRGLIHRFITDPTLRRFGR